MSVAQMAKPKRKTESAKDPKTIGFRVTGEYAEWVDRLATKNRSTVAGLIDQSLARFAKEIGFTEEPPERTP